MGDELLLFFFDSPISIEWLANRIEQTVVWRHTPKAHKHSTARARELGNILWKRRVQLEALGCSLWFFFSRHPKKAVPHVHIDWMWHGSVQQSVSASLSSLLSWTWSLHQLRREKIPTAQTRFEWTCCGTFALRWLWLNIFDDFWYR